MGQRLMQRREVKQEAGWHLYLSSAWCDLGPRQIRLQGQERGLIPNHVECVCPPSAAGPGVAPSPSSLSLRQLLDFLPTQ